MLNRNIFRSYDVRGLYPEEVNIESAKVITEALATIWQPGKILVAHDARHGGPELLETVTERTIECGKKLGKDFEVIHVGLSSTPMFYFLVNHMKASGGVIITASHNPKEYNGMKPVKVGAEAISGLEILEIVNKNESRV